MDNRLDTPWIALRLGIGLTATLAGIDKFFNLLADWPRYLSPAAEAILPVTGQTFMYFAGVVEMVVGLAILTRWTVIGSYVAAVWLVAIAVNLVASGNFLDVAVRDLVMATAAYTLARLTEASESTRTPAAVPVDAQADRTRLGKVA